MPRWLCCRKCWGEVREPSLTLAPLEAKSRSLTSCRTWRASLLSPAGHRGCERSSPARGFASPRFARVSCVPARTFRPASPVTGSRNIAGLPPPPAYLEPLPVLREPREKSCVRWLRARQRFRSGWTRHSPLDSPMSFPRQRRLCFRWRTPRCRAHLLRESLLFGSRISRSPARHTAARCHRSSKSSGHGSLSTTTKRQPRTQKASEAISRRLARDSVLRNVCGVPNCEVGLRCSGFKYALCRLRSLAAQRCYFYITHLLVINKEIFYLLQQNGRQIHQFPNLGEEHRGLSDPDDAVVAFASRIPLVYLTRQHHAREPAIDLATREGRLLAKYQHIEGIAVFSVGPRKEAEVKRKNHPLRHDLGELEAAGFFIQLVFVAATARCLYDHRNDL